MRNHRGKFAYFTVFRYITVALLVATSGVNWSSPASAAIIHESATLGALGHLSSGFSVSGAQFIGSRFSVSSTYTVDNIGGHLRQVPLIGNGLIFGSIISLTSPTALPTGSPFSSVEELAFTIFAPGTVSSSDVLTPLSLTLTPGDYALVFGSGLHGATGEGVLAANNTDIAGSSSYFHRTPTTWVDGSVVSTRFVVTGNLSPVPLPAALPLYLSAIAGFGFMARRKKQQRDAGKAPLEA